MQRKVQVGNSHAQFLLELLVICQEMGLLYWVENPDGSFLWLLTDWREKGFGSPEAAFRFDMCRYHTPWRKRTRIATNTCLSGRRELCHGDHSHVILRGRCKAQKMSWTRLAQAYPQQLGYDLASAMAAGAGLTKKNTKLNIGGCAKCSHCRIGEAQNPGPQKARRVARDVKLLENVRLVEPATLALQDRFWTAFRTWLDQHLSESTIDDLQLCPTLYVALLRFYGFFLFSRGHGLYEFRHLLVIIQQRFPWVKPHLSPAWQLITRWQVLQPVQHRKPLHWVLCQAMASLAILKNWQRWTAVLLLGFFGIARISEVLRALRSTFRTV
jgi:hypothetical protein